MILGTNDAVTDRTFARNQQIHELFCVVLQDDKNLLKICGKQYITLTISQPGVILMCLLTVGLKNKNQTINGFMNTCIYRNIDLIYFLQVLMLNVLIDSGFVFKKRKYL